MHTMSANCWNLLGVNVRKTADKNCLLLAKISLLCYIIDRKTAAHKGVAKFRNRKIRSATRQSLGGFSMSRYLQNMKITAWVCSLAVFFMPLLLLIS